MSEVVTMGNRTYSFEELTERILLIANAWVPNQDFFVVELISKKVGGTPNEFPPKLYRVHLIVRQTGASDNKVVLSLDSNTQPSHLLALARVHERVMDTMLHRMGEISRMLEAAAEEA